MTGQDRLRIALGTWVWHNRRINIKVMDGISLSIVAEEEEEQAVVDEEVLP